MIESFLNLIGIKIMIGVINIVKVMVNIMKFIFEKKNRVKFYRCYI